MNSFNIAPFLATQDEIIAYACFRHREPYLAN